MENVGCYPYHFDYKMEGVYALDKVVVFTRDEGYSHYSLFGSEDGENFSLIARKTNHDACDAKTGDIYFLNGYKAAVIRILYEYYSEDYTVERPRVEYVGERVATAPDRSQSVQVCDFNKSEYNVEITDEDTVDELYGIVSRTVGDAYKAWFDFSVSKCEEYDYFRIEADRGRVKISGNTGVCIATGLNYYYKYFCNVSISQVGNQTGMPESIVLPPQPIVRKTQAKIRYAYNYCTHSYTMAFWGEKEWRRELDYLALNGINAVLDITAQEEVWRRFLDKLGYPIEEIKKFIAGPGYYAWAYMGNLFGLGGPVHHSHFGQRTQLARRNHLIMRKLGMVPILQGYSGMVPPDINRYDCEAEKIEQGTWAALRRPDMLLTTSPSFKKYAKLFYESQREVYGDITGYYAADPFHEGGKTEGLSFRVIAKNVLSEMLAFREDAVWVIQSWESNPKSELLKGISDVTDGRDHALILDIYGEKDPKYNKGAPGSVSYGYAEEFDGTPWVYGMINNFGGRMGLHGHMDFLKTETEKVFRTAKHIRGIGIVPEASEENPILYDYFLETVWQEQEEFHAPDLCDWVRSYQCRRYGAYSPNAYRALMLLCESVYHSEYNKIGQGAKECIANARPQVGLKKVSAWGGCDIEYDTAVLKEAERLLRADYEIFKDNEGYIYDLTAVRQQLLSNEILETYQSMSAAYTEKDIALFERESDRFLKIIDKMEAGLDNCRYFRFSEYLSKVKKYAAQTDDFSKRLYEIQARALVTTWGNYLVSERGRLHDYSNRQWSGLMQSFYKPRWEIWIANCRNELNGKPFEPDFDWFKWEWQWVCNV